ncbi:hypothetical protein FisN_9Lh283 [Fistulifera solaris]|uniref:3'-5' exonuclease domain-containing protein n=1 Tax=Fistulifera solaris TaxID=1519565 RepID=A0A1Z5KLB7_FISSO|nr:hypothetical protein FisN_9Lh283 [Fistulifera solaris]|eukprot:GAX26977.1 hypothetical protein FisN_9Lh283 [Fistulifera solaris]
MTALSFHTSSSLSVDQQRCNASKLGRAAGSQSLETLQQALEGWTAADLDNLPGKNPLHMAAWQGCIENVIHLVEHVGCNVNSISAAEFSYGKTPIFFAATKCRNDVVLYLLEQGACVTIVNNKGQSVRSIASSHLLPHVIERICHYEQLQGQWTNYRKTHSDSLEYGDLDPRFLERPLRENDIVTEHAVNPTTKQSRQGSFLRKNPHLVVKPKTTTNNRKPRRKPPSNALSAEEANQVSDTWTRVLETLKRIDILFKNDDASALEMLQQDIMMILQLSDKQKGSWIPEAAQRLQTVGTAFTRIAEYLTSLSVRGNVSKRERALLTKLVAEMLGTRRNESVLEVTTSSKDSSHHSQALQALILDRREELDVILANESIARFQLSTPGIDDGVLHLPEPPYWVDTLSEELLLLEEVLLHCRLTAIDTEWYNRSDGTIHVATLQIAIPGHERPWVLDLLKESLEFQQRSKDLVQHILFDPSRLILGFAMGNDLPKLELWLGTELPRNTCLDIQMLHGGDQLKGLARIVQLYSKCELSKKEQCSSWSDRPLSDAQMEYAGLDAAILPALMAEWLRQ